MKKLTKEIFESRLTKVVSNLEKKKANLGLFFSVKTIYYLTGFRFIPTERPIALLTPIDEEPIIFLPQLEITHWEKNVPWITNIENYYEYPDFKHPMKLLASVLEKTVKGDKIITADGKGAPGFWGYEGPLLTEILNGWKFLDCGTFIPDLRIIKEPLEIEFIKTSAKWGQRAHKILQEECANGKSEGEVTLKATEVASKELQKELPDASPSMLPAYAGFRGQIGKNSALPHAIFSNLTMKAGDILVTGASADIFHYYSELERTMIIGQPTPKQERYFTAMLNAQTAAIDTIKPGATCADVDNASFSSFKSSGFDHLVLHHTGHGIGLEGHERPFLDRGLETKLQPGMVLTVEPGIYELDFGGFRHSDTVLVTEEGNEVLTINYPRDLNSLTIQI